MKKKVIVLIYGEGGHKKEMDLFLNSIADPDLINLVTIGPSDISTLAEDHYNIFDVRDKNNRLTSIIKALIGGFRSSFLSIKLINKYKITGLISTGPGLALIPFCIMRVFGVKTVFIETFCRFDSRSITGILMYKISSRFLVQNKELLKLYPKAEYCGRL